MATKATWLFNGASQDGENTWGFSESWYTSLSGDALVTAMDLVSSRRVQMLSVDTKIVGYRIGTTLGRSYVVRKSFAPPGTNDHSNLPVDAALCTVGITGSDSRKRFFFHDLPDNWVTSMQVTESREDAIRLVVQTLCAAGFMVRAQNPANAVAPILEISALGVVKTSLAFAALENNTVTLLNCRDINGRAVTGNYIVSNVASPTQFTLAHWPGNVVARSGKVRLSGLTFTPAVYLGSQTIVRGGSRKVGRPFFQLRGRVPNRR